LPPPTPPRIAVEVALTGVFELPKAAAAVTQGARAYWDGSKVIASGGVSDVLLGAVVATARADSATCQIEWRDVMIAGAKPKPIERALARPRRTRR
jgi:hypothetical protein